MSTIQLPSDVESLSAEAVLRYCVEQFPGKVALACSFQKEESILLDMLFAIEPKARVFAIDTHYLFPETYELWREVERRYDTKVEVFEGPTPEELAATHGEQLWERKPDLYLAIAKVEPLVRARAGLAPADDVWKWLVWGLPRGQQALDPGGQDHFPYLALIAEVLTDQQILHHLLGDG